MTTAHYVIALVRLALLACPVLVTAHLVRTRCSALRGAPAILVESVLALAWLLVVAELLGRSDGQNGDGRFRIESPEIVALQFGPEIRPSRHARLLCPFRRKRRANQ